MDGLIMVVTQPSNVCRSPSIVERWQGKIVCRGGIEFGSIRVL